MDDSKLKDLQDKWLSEGKTPRRRAWLTYYYKNREALLSRNKDSKAKKIKARRNGYGGMQVIEVDPTALIS